jgi:hypothetical protein
VKEDGRFALTADRAVVNGASKAVSALRASVPSAALDPFDPSTWACGCVAHQVKTMMAMAETSRDFPVLSFAKIADWAGIGLEETKAAVRQLAKKGVTEYWFTSWDDDGGFVGAGYALTDRGRAAAQAIEARRAETGTGSVHESAVGEADAPNTPDIQP